MANEGTPATALGRGVVFYEVVDSTWPGQGTPRRLLAAEWFFMVVDSTPHLSTPEPPKLMLNTAGLLPGPRPRTLIRQGLHRVDQGLRGDAIPRS